MMPEEKVRRELHKDTVCCFDQISEARPNKTGIVHPLTSQLTKHLIS